MHRALSTALALPLDTSEAIELLSPTLLKLTQAAIASYKETLRLQNQSSDILDQKNQVPKNTIVIDWIDLIRALTRVATTSSSISNSGLQDCIQALLELLQLSELRLRIYTARSLVHISSNSWSSCGVETIRSLTCLVANDPIWLLSSIEPMFEQKQNKSSHFGSQKQGYSVAELNKSLDSLFDAILRIASEDPEKETSVLLDLLAVFCTYHGMGLPNHQLRILRALQRNPHVLFPTRVTSSQLYISSTRTENAQLFRDLETFYACETRSSYINYFNATIRLFTRLCVSIPIEFMTPDVVETINVGLSHTTLLDRIIESTHGFKSSHTQGSFSITNANERRVQIQEIVLFVRSRFPEQQLMHCVEIWSRRDCTPLLSKSCYFFTELLNWAYMEQGIIAAENGLPLLWSLNQFENVQENVNVSLQ